MTKPTFRALVCRLGYIIDQYAVPPAIAYFLLAKLIRVVYTWPRAFESGIIFSGFMADSLVALYNAVTLWAFLIRKKPKVNSETVAEVAVPLATIAVYMSLNVLGRVPAIVNPLLVPVKYIFPLSLAGSSIVFAGLTISVIAIFQLRRSIAVIVQVRDVVSHGFYRRVRHPVYLGYFIQMIGFLLTFPYLWTILWAIMSGCFFIIRARLEENKLAAFSPAYREYMKHTPFLIPFLIK